MELTARFDIPRAAFSIDPGHQTGFVGSCFSDHMGGKLSDLDFDTWQNPFGTIYNPYTIGKMLSQAALFAGTGAILPEDIVFYKDMALYLDYPKRCSTASNRNGKYEEFLDEDFRKLQKDLLTTKVLFITWGTSTIYWYKETGKIAGNCHKLPSTYFEKGRLSVTEITEQYIQLAEVLGQIVPGIRIVLTVSPVRHWRDGLEANQESKAVLLLAKSELCRLLPAVFNYFPAYEIMMDELRDYRFYDRDLYHPNALAIDYIFERFSATYFSEDTRQRNELLTAFKRGLSHKVNFTGKEENLAHLRHLVKLAAELKKKTGKDVYQRSLYEYATTGFPFLQDDPEFRQMFS